MAHRLNLSLRLLALCATLAAAPAYAISLGQIDDFEDGTVAAWQKGPATQLPPTNIADGGPMGAGDGYLEVVSIGGFGPDSAMVFFNLDQWAGDYVSAGVTSISAQMANFGDTDMFMRLAIEGAGSRYGSADAFFLPADGLWYDVVFSLAAGDLVDIGSGVELDIVLANVDVLRILSAEAGPAYQGDRIEAVLGLDNIAATAVPLPAALWLFAGALMGLAGTRRN